MQFEPILIKMKSALYFIEFLCIYSTTEVYVKAATFDEVEDLQRTLLNGYDKNIRPFIDTETAMDVNASFNLVSIKEFDEVNGRFSVVGYMTVIWYDKRMTWNPEEHNNTYAIHVQETEVWTPKIVLVNPYDNLDRLGKDFFQIVYYYSGIAVWSPGDIFSGTCAADVTYFPFDKQLCTLTYTCWGFGAHEIMLQPLSNEVYLHYFAKHGTWELLDSNVTLSIKGGIPFLDVNIHIKRRPAFFVVNIILPILFMIALNIWVFILPVESGERVSYSITVLLALAVFLTLVSENLPKTSEPMSILSYYLLTALILSSVSCFMTVLNMYVYYLSDDVALTSLVKCFVGVCFCHRKDTVSPCANSNNLEKTEIKGFDEDLERRCDPEIKITWKQISGFMDKFMIYFNVFGLVCLSGSFFLATML